MIDATKLVDYQEYWISFRDKAPRMARYFAAHGWFYAMEGLTYEAHEVLTAIPIPSPEALAEMWEVISDVHHCEKYGLEIDFDLYEKMKTLLEKRT